MLQYNFPTFPMSAPAIIKLPHMFRQNIFIAPKVRKKQSALPLCDLLDKIALCLDDAFMLAYGRLAYDDVILSACRVRVIDNIEKGAKLELQTKHLSCSSRLKVQVKVFCKEHGVRKDLAHARISFRFIKSIAVATKNNTNFNKTN